MLRKTEFLLFQFTKIGLLAGGPNSGGLSAVLETAMEDTEEDNNEQVGDGDRGIKDKEFQSKVKSDCREFRLRSLSSSCKSSANKISEERIQIVQEQDKSMIAKKVKRDVCHVEGKAAFKINNNTWKCELEMNI